MAILSGLLLLFLWGADGQPGADTPPGDPPAVTDAAGVTADATPSGTTESAGTAAEVAPAKQDPPPAEKDGALRHVRPPRLVVPLLPRERGDGFGFGSYGRVTFGTNRDGEPVYPVNIAAHGPRLEESTYVELDLYYKLRPMRGLRSKMVATLALNDSLFHYDGTWDSGLAVRNLYLEMTPVAIPGLSFWAGSRMYRGDDIYLLDYWPLDNLNTLGAGVWWDRQPLRGGIHVGINRVLGPYQYQEEAVNTVTVGESTIATLNRQRLIASAKLEYWKQVNDTLGFKVKGYGEFHRLPQGTYNALGEPEERIDLPAEGGFVAGLQGGLWGFSPHSFVNVFARYASGIAAYGEFSQPLGLGWQPDLGRDYSAAGARDFVLAAVGNYVLPGRLGVQFGAYWRTFEDADGLDHDWDDGNELVVALRPMLFVPELVGRQIALAAELSWQRTERAGLHPETDMPAHPSVWKISILPTWISGPDTYSRPAVRLFYTIALPNEDARLWYHQLDYRRTRSVEHFVGISAEWWFNSSTYQ